MRIAVIFALALALGATLAAAAPRHFPPRHVASRHAALRRAAPPRLKTQPFDVKPGTELTIPIAIVDGKAVAGVPHASKLGASPPQDGEITVGLEREQGTLYNQIAVVEKTARPINFLVTGLNGDIKIDEAEICGRLDAPIAAHIGSIPWQFRLNGFEVGKGAGSCD
ncbi:MAG: hypothetical protein ABR929_03690 [Roseiarcus sp.]|jgi:hypothetical protein